MKTINAVLVVLSILVVGQCVWAAEVEREQDIDKELRFGDTDGERRCGLPWRCCHAAADSLTPKCWQAWGLAAVAPERLLRRRETHTAASCLYTHHYGIIASTLSAIPCDPDPKEARHDLSARRGRPASTPTSHPASPLRSASCVA